MKNKHMPCKDIPSYIIVYGIFLSKIKKKLNSKTNRSSYHVFDHQTDHISIHFTVEIIFK